MEDNLDAELTKFIRYNKKRCNKLGGKSIAGSDFLPNEPSNDVALDENQLLL